MVFNFVLFDFRYFLGYFFLEIFFDFFNYVGIYRLVKFYIIFVVYLLDIIIIINQFDQEGEVRYLSVVFFINVVNVFMNYEFVDKVGNVVVLVEGFDLFEGILVVKNLNFWWLIGMSD